MAPRKHRSQELQSPSRPLLKRFHRKPRPTLQPQRRRSRNAGLSLYTSDPNGTFLTYIHQRRPKPQPGKICNHLPQHQRSRQRQPVFRNGRCVPSSRQTTTMQSICGGEGTTTIPTPMMIPRTADDISDPRVRRRLPATGVSAISTILLFKRPMAGSRGALSPTTGIARMISAGASRMTSAMAPRSMARGLAAGAFFTDFNPLNTRFHVFYQVAGKGIVEGRRYWGENDKTVSAEWTYQTGPVQT